MSTLLQSHVVSPHVSVHPYETVELNGRHIRKILSRTVPASAGTGDGTRPFPLDGSLYVSVRSHKQRSSYLCICQAQLSPSPSALCLGHILALGTTHSSRIAGWQGALRFIGNSCDHSPAYDFS